MPTITIKHGKKTLKLTKRERDQIEAVLEICADIEDHYDHLDKDAGMASLGLGNILKHIDNSAAKAAEPTKFDPTAVLNSDLRVPDDAKPKAAETKFDPNASVDAMAEAKRK